MKNQTNKGVFARRIAYQIYTSSLEASWRSVLLITFLAVHRPAFRRLERDLCFSSAVRTLHGVHLPWPGAETAIVSAWSVVDEDYLLIQSHQIPFGTQR